VLERCCTEAVRVEDVQVSFVDAVNLYTD